MSQSSRHSDLTPRKRALLQTLLQKEGLHTGHARSIPRRNDNSVAPLSLAQQRMWFLEQLGPGRSAFNIAGAMSLHGPLNVGALAWALSEVVSRHEALRTNFSFEADELVQVVTPNLSLPLPTVDLRQWRTSRREAAARRLASEEAKKPFDLLREPLLRCKLLRLADEKHVLLLTAHHIIADGWSVTVLLRELGTLYATHLEGEPSSLPDPPVQYADFALWQRERLRGEELEREVSFWRRQLRGAPAALELPSDRPRPAKQTFRGAIHRFGIPASLSEKLRLLGRREGATLFMTLLAAFKVLLQRYSGQDDLVVGTPVAGRNHPELEGSIGFFVSTLVLRTQLDDGLSFREVLLRVRDTALQAYEHQDVPFERLLEEVRSDRHLSRNPLFQVMFALQNAPREAPALQGLTVEPMEVDREAAMFDLTLYVSETEQGLRGTLEYSSDLFEASTVERMAGHYLTLLESLASNPNGRIGEAALLTDKERCRLLFDWNNTRTGDPNDRCVHELFEERALKMPGAKAVIHGDEELTYRELNERANRLARHLRGFGVGPEVLVGVCLERSPELVASLLGVLKAGGAYVPLDPSYPKERLEFMLGDSAPTVVVTQERLRGLLPGGETRVVCVDTDWPEIAKERGADLASATTPANLAYVIYTSGSTGEPKGVAVQHESLANYSEVARVRYDLDDKDCVLQFASISFDISVEEIFASLVSGATLRLRSDSMLYTITAFLDQCRDWKISVLDLPTAYWHQLVTELCTETTPSLPPSLRLVIIGGEAVSPEKLALWQRCVDRRVRLLNTYGPTETTVAATMRELTDLTNTRYGSVRVPVGRPIANSRVYVLDYHRRPVPVGVAGELFIGGVGVARGYLGRPALTAERFVPDPFAGESGARVYGTGGLARWLPDGDLEILGRMDHQVKVKSFRVEPGEVEAALQNHPEVRQSAVLARGDEAEDTRLVAYVVTQEKGDLSTSEIRSFLQRKLPAHMVPSAFVALESLPLTPGGKVDREALQEYEVEWPPESGKGYAAPRTATETKLTQIWAEVLGAERVGVNDDFFALGGDSMAIIHVLAKARRLGLPFSPNQLFEHQTVANLAEVVDADANGNRPQEQVQGPVPLTPYQEQFLSLNPPDDLHRMTLGVLLRVAEPLDPELVARAVQKVVKHHDALRLTFTSDGSTWRQSHATHVERPPVDHVDLSTTPADDRTAAMQTFADKTRDAMNMSSGPLIRFVFFHFGDEEKDRMLIVANHLICDPYSLQIIVEDLETAYTQLRVGGPTTLPPKTSSFKYFSERLARYTRSSEVDEELDYWLNLSKRLPRTDLSAHRFERGAIGGRTVRVSLEPWQTRQLLSTIQTQGLTQVSDAALGALLSSYAGLTNERSVLVNWTHHGRIPPFDDMDLSRTVGWTTASIPLLLPASPTASLLGTAESIRTHIESIPFGGIGYYSLYSNKDDPRVTDELRAIRRNARLKFNFVGALGDGFDSALFEPAEERIEVGYSVSKQPYTLRVAGHVSHVDSSITFDVEYDDSFYESPFVEDLAVFMLEKLADLPQG